MAWLGFCMFWLGFVYPRSHSGWIGPIGVGAPVFAGKPAYRYSILFPTDLPSLLRHRLAFLSQIVPVQWRDLLFVYFDWVLYPSRLADCVLYTWTIFSFLKLLFFIYHSCSFLLFIYDFPAPEKFKRDMKGSLFKKGLLSKCDISIWLLVLKRVRQT